MNKKELWHLRRKYIGEILKEITSIINCPDWATRVRRRLNIYVRELPNDYKWVAQDALLFLKDKFRTFDDNSPNDNHIVSDHAFVRALERVYGFDVSCLKSMVMRDVMKNAKYDFVGNEDKFFTILPKMAKS